jgi:hypothetical protein
MRITKLRYLSLAVVALSAAAAAQACSPTAPEDVVETPGADAEPGPVDSGNKKDATSNPNPNTGDTGPFVPPDASTITDTGAPDSSQPDARPDATSDAGQDAADAAVDAAVAPPTGAPCATPGATLSKSCGFCGTTSAFCEADSKVGEYGRCIGDVVNGCTPGTQRVNPCGLCGSRAEVCQNTCQWAGGACLNEPANACSPGSFSYTQTGCVDPLLFRKVTCSPACQFSLPEPPPCKAKEFPTLTLGNAVGRIASGTFETSKLVDAIPRLDLFGGVAAPKCPRPVSATNTPFVYVKVVNPNNTAALVDVYANNVPNGTELDTVMTSYLSLPVDTASRGACVNRVSDSGGGDPGVVSPECNTSVVAYGRLCGGNGVSVPANGSAYILVQAYGSGATTAEKSFILSTKIQTL